MDEIDVGLENELNIEDWNKILRHPRLGEILLQHRKLTIHQLDNALKEQISGNIPLGQILLQMKIVSKDELLELLELQVGISKMLNESFDQLRNVSSRDQFSKLIEIVELETTNEEPAEK